jgi:glycosyltransferase involved in cell wall biosynthesis
MKSPPDITVIIPTRDRAPSLRITLECLATANRAGIQAEVLVVDNCSTDDTKEVVASFQNRIPLRYLYQPALGVYGKSHSLNLALNQDGLGDIIAVLDDDMSPYPEWFQGVAAVCARWPDKDIFSGAIFTVWPCENVPAWARTLKGKSEALVFSTVDLGEKESVLEDGRWYSGNQFWFRQRALRGTRRFKDIWLTEPDFQLDLMELGSGGVGDPSVKAGHRIQAALLQKEGVLQRSKKFGREEAWLRLQPYRQRVKQARQLHSHPWLGRLYCLAYSCWWRVPYAISYFHSSDGEGFNRRLEAACQIAYYRELLKVMAKVDDYSLWSRRRAAGAASRQFVGNQ